MAINDEIIRLGAYGHYFQSRLKLVAQQEEILKAEESMKQMRLYHAGCEIAVLQADIDFQNARPREAEEAHRKLTLY
jgi:hypothetical protein